MSTARHRSTSVRFWWPWRRRRPGAGGASRAVPSGRVGGVPRWAVLPTREYPAVRSAPLMTPAQEFRGRGGRWSR